MIKACSVKKKLVESPVKKAFLSTIQAGLSCTPLFHKDDATSLALFKKVSASHSSKHCMAWVRHSLGTNHSKPQIKNPVSHPRNGASF
jgi:hypothetical protein